MKTAAAVLELGRFVQSPMPQTLLNSLCLKVCLLQSRYPAGSASPDSAI